MNDIAFAWGIGAVCGSRSMLGPALVANTLAPGPARGLTKIVAAVEMLADKSAHVGARTDALPLTGRVATGALSAAACAAPGRRLRAAAAGAAGALAFAYGLYHLRRFVTGRLGVPDAAAGLSEDALAMAMGGLLLRHR